MSAVLLPFPEPTREPGAPPMRVLLAIDRNGFVMQARPGDTGARFDREYPACAPHRMCEFVEVVP